MNKHVNVNADLIKRALEVWDQYPNFFEKDFFRRVPVLEAYSQNRVIEYSEFGSVWTKNEGFGFSFDSFPERYRIASEMTVIDLNGEKFEINISRDKEMGLIKKIS